MQQIIDFIVTNYELIISGILLVISVVTFILRKRPVSSIDSDIFRICLEAVCLAENGNAKGEEKLNLATTYVLKHLSHKFPSLDLCKYVNYIQDIIEAILSTPKKK